MDKFRTKLEEIRNNFELENIVLYNRMSGHFFSCNEKLNLSREKIIKTVKELLNNFGEKEILKGCADFGNQYICYFIPETNPDFFIIFFSNFSNINLNAIIIEIEEILNHFQ